jgi:hypothetical protein
MIVRSNLLVIIEVLLYLLILIRQLVVTIRRQGKFSHWVGVVTRFTVAVTESRSLSIAVRWDFVVYSSDTAAPHSVQMSSCQATVTRTGWVSPHRGHSACRVLCFPSSVIESVAT